MAGQRTRQRLLQETREPGRQRGGILGLFVSIQFDLISYLYLTLSNKRCNNLGMMKGFYSKYLRFLEY